MPISPGPRAPMCRSPREAPSRFSHTGKGASKRAPTTAVSLGRKVVEIDGVVRRRASRLALIRAIEAITPVADGLGLVRRAFAPSLGSGFGRCALIACFRAGCAGTDGASGIRGGAGAGTGWLRSTFGWNGALRALTRGKRGSLRHRDRTVCLGSSEHERGLVFVCPGRGKTRSEPAAQEHSARSGESPQHDLTSTSGDLRPMPLGHLAAERVDATRLKHERRLGLAPDGGRRTSPGP